MRNTRQQNGNAAMDSMLDRVKLVDALAREVLVRLHNRLRETPSLKLLDGTLATISQAGPPIETKDGDLQSRIAVELDKVGDLEFTLRLTASGTALLAAKECKD